MGNSIQSFHFYQDNHQNNLKNNNNFPKNFKPIHTQTLQITEQDLLFKKYSLPPHYRILNNTYNFLSPHFYSSLTNTTLQRTQIKIDIKKQSNILHKNFVYGVCHSDIIVAPIFIQLNYQKQPNSVYLYTQLSCSSIKQIRIFSNLQLAFKSLIQVLKGIQAFYNVFHFFKVQQENIVISKSGKIKIKSQNMSQLMTYGAQNICFQQKKDAQKQFQIVLKVIRIFDSKINFIDQRKNNIFQNFLIAKKTINKQTKRNIRIKEALNIFVQSSQYFCDPHKIKQKNQFTNKEKLFLKQDLCQNISIRYNQNDRFYSIQDNCNMEKENCFRKCQQSLIKHNDQLFSSFYENSYLQHDKINLKSYGNYKEDLKTKEDNHKRCISSISIVNEPKYNHEKYKKTHLKNSYLNINGHHRAESEVVSKSPNNFYKQHRYKNPSNFQSCHQINNSKSNISLASQTSSVFNQNQFFQKIQKEKQIKYKYQSSTANSSLNLQNKSSFFKIDQINSKNDRLTKKSYFTQFNPKILKKNKSSQLAYTAKKNESTNFLPYYKYTAVTQQKIHQIKNQQRKGVSKSLEKIFKQNYQRHKHSSSSQQNTKNQKLLLNNLIKNESIDSLKLKITQQIVPIDQTKRQYDIQDVTQHQISGFNNKLQIQNKIIDQNKKETQIYSSQSIYKKGSALKRNSSQIAKIGSRKQYPKNLTYNYQVKIFQYDENLQSQRSSFNTSNFYKSNKKKVLQVDLNQKDIKKSQELYQPYIIKNMKSHEDRIKQKVQRLSISRGLNDHFNINSLNAVLTTKSIKAQKSQSEISFVIDKYDMY